MTVYDYIYEFYNTLFSIDTDNSFSYIGDVYFEIGGSNLSLQSWLCDTLSIITIILIAIFFIKLTIWFFKQGANLFKW